MKKSELEKALGNVVVVEQSIRPGDNVQVFFNDGSNLTGIVCKPPSDQGKSWSIVTLEPETVYHIFSCELVRIVSKAHDNLNDNGGQNEISQ